MTNNVIKKVYKNGVEYQIYGSAGAEGAGDVTGPSSATSGHLAVFDGATGKTIKDGGAVPTGVPSGGSDGQFLGKSSGNLTWTNAPVTSVNGSTGAVTGLQTTSNLKTSLSDNSDSYYPSQKAVKTAVDGKQDELVSGTNIKTINGESVLGNGNISISAPSYTAGNGIDITNEEIGLDGTYDGKDYSAMQGPAPDGFHVPLNAEWQAVKDIWTALGGGSTDGTNFGIALKLPFAGFRDYTSADVGGQGTSGHYWSSSRITNYAYYLYLGSVGPGSTNYPSIGFSIRCFKNSPTMPTSSWTKLYGTSIESGGIFWSSTDGLISLSSDGNTWITIMDKNLGATTVWNNGDTLSEANCGKYYQRGNNYGFAWTGSVTTSSTQVNASTYGPGNYYSSSTFIKHRKWDTSDNLNLRGGVTGILTASGRLVVGDKLYKIVISTTTPSSGTASNIITISTGDTKGLYVGTTKIV